jgi:cytochrome c biogenesis protein
MPFGTIVAHVSLLLIMLGAFLTATTGFKDTQFTVPVGTTVPVGHGTNLSVEATAFTDSYYLDGSPKNYQSDIVLYQNGKAVAKKTVRVNHPLRWGGVSFYQSFFGVAAAMKVQSEAGKTVYDRGVPLLWQSKDGRHSVGQFALPASGLTVYVVTAASGQEDPEIKAGQAQVEVYRGNGDTPVAVKVLSQGKPVSIQGMRFTFERMRQFTGLIVTRDRGALFVWLGCALLALGVFLVLFFPHRRVWVQVRETQDGSEVRCGAMRREASRRDTAFESGFNRLAEDIQRAATPLGTHEGRAE